MARIVVDVMPKPEILDPQGKAVTGALARLAHTVRGVASNFAIPRVLDSAQDLEKLARANSVAALPSALDGLRTAIARIRPELEAVVRAGHSAIS